MKIIQTSNKGRYATASEIITTKQKKSQNTNSLFLVRCALCLCFGLIGPSFSDVQKIYHSYNVIVVYAVF